MKVNFFKKELSRNGNFTMYNKWVIAKKMTDNKWVFFGSVYIVEKAAYSGAWKSKPIFGNVVFVGEVSEETKVTLQERGYCPSKALQLTKAKVEIEALRQQPSFSYEEGDWWHGINVDGIELDIQYLDDETQNLYVYEVVKGKRSEYELMVIPLDWEFSKKLCRFQKAKKEL